MAVHPRVSFRKQSGARIEITSQAKRIRFDKTGILDHMMGGKQVI
jgi:hypothetical protein